MFDLLRLAYQADVTRVHTFQYGRELSLRSYPWMGADPNGTDAYGSTALHWAVELDNLTAVVLLLQAGANPGAVNRYNVAPLSVAAEAGHAAVIVRLLRGAP